ncbi:MAG: heavy metal-binding domain-containing protein [Chloroflexota bacterium]
MASCGAAGCRAAAAAEQARRDEESLAALRGGGLPLHATERLTRAAEGSALWTSNLSIDDALSLAPLQYQPLGHVLGASVYHVGYNIYNVGQWSSGDVTMLSSAMYAARDLALGRMVQEAQLLGAHGIVDVNLEERAYDWGSHLIDVVANGTAVRLRAAAPPLPRPFVCNLPAQKALALLRLGYVPVHLVMGFAAYYQVTSWADEQQMRGWRSSWQNSEMASFTQAMSNARHLGIDRMKQDAAQHGAEGIIGSEIAFSVHEIGVSRTSPWSGESERIEDHLVRFTAVGTALAALSSRDTLGEPHPTLALDS